MSLYRYALIEGRQAIAELLMRSGAIDEGIGGEDEDASPAHACAWIGTRLEPSPTDIGTTCGRREHCSQPRGQPPGRHCVTA
jgi:hypothetical protein